MTESTPVSSPHDSHSRNSFFKSDLYLTYIKPAMYIALAIFFLVIAKLFNAGTKVAFLGTVCIILLTVSKIRKNQFGIFLSMVFLVLMVMVNIWHWVATFFDPIFSGEIAHGQSIFPVGLIEGIITLTTVWFYHKLLKNMNMRISHEWFVKESQLKFLRLLFLFQMFLMFFLISAYVIHTVKAGSHYDEHEATLFAGVIALIAAGIPTLMYLFRNPGTHTKHNHHHHHHHHHQHRPNPEN